MAQITAPGQFNPSPVPCSSEPSATTLEPGEHDEAVVRGPAQPFEDALHRLMGLIDRAIARIRHCEGEDVALQDISDTLLRLRAMVAHDPGIKMAVHDLYGTALAIVAGHGAGDGGADVRRWRLLTEASGRLRARLGTAQPSEEARLLGLH